MMADVDALSMLYGKLITSHVGVPYILKDRDLRQRPDAYNNKYFFACKN